MARPWTEDEINRACALRREGKSLRDIGLILHRHKANVSDHLHDRGFPRLKGNQRGVRLDLDEPAPRPPSQQEIERQALLRARAAQDPISALMGDPPPGWSALDRSRRAGVAP